MKKNELIAKLEGAKELTSVVSIDLVLTALGMLEDETPQPKGFSFKPSQFEMLMDKIQQAVDNMDRRELVDRSSAEFELDWNNTISLNDVEVDFDYVYNSIREELEELVEDEEDEFKEEAELTCDPGCGCCTEGGTFQN
jgi:hypothetical protein